jgi:hypothetical protein
MSIRYRWLRKSTFTSAWDERFYDVGVNDDGTLYNPNGYPEADVREVIAAAQARRTERRKKAAAQAASTRQRRHELRVHKIAQTLVEQRQIGARHWCACCQRQLSDPESIARGIGPECWDGVLARIEALQASKQQV